MHYVYILFSKKLGKFYCGYSTDLKNRLSAHNTKQVPFTTSSCPWRLVYYSAFVCKKDAIEEEKFLKSGKGRERRKYLLSEYTKRYLS